MRDNLTEIVIILDRSGSMQTIKTAMEAALNGFISEQRSVPGDAHVTLVQFGSYQDVIYENEQIENVREITINPSGMTRLLDTVGTAINMVGKRLEKTPEYMRPGKVLVAIITDGEENSSTEFTSEDIREMIKHQTDVYNWQFTYLGANQDAFAVSDSLGIQRSATMNYDATTDGAKMSIKNLSASAASYRSGTEFSY